MGNTSSDVNTEMTKTLETVEEIKVFGSSALMEDVWFHRTDQ